MKNLVAVGNDYPLVRDFVNLDPLGFLMVGHNLGDSSAVV